MIKLFEDTPVGKQWAVEASAGTWTFRGIVSEFFNGCITEEDVEAYVQSKAPRKLTFVKIEEVV